MKILTKMSLRTKHKTVFLQITQAKPYHGHQAGHSNVMSMLEVLLDRFQKSYDELQSQEKQSQGDFNDMKAELSARIAANQQRATGTSRKTVTKVGEFTRLKADLRSQNAILTAAFTMLQELIPDCVETHKEKIDKIQATIDSLQSA